MGTAASEVGRRAVVEGDSHSSSAVQVQPGQLTNHSYSFSLVNENCEGNVCCTASTIVVFST